MSILTMLGLLILAIAAFGAGTLNTVAGGGTFLTLPALIFTGAPLARAIPRQPLRLLIAAIGFGMSLIFLLRLF